MTGRKRPHPIYILQSIPRFFVLLALPLARGAISALTGGFIAWVEGAWFDLTVVGAILGLATLRWALCLYRADGGSIQVDSGLFFRRHTVIPTDGVITLSLVESFWLRPLGAVVLRADTAGGSFNKADFSLTLWREEAQRLLTLRELENQPDFLPRWYRPRGLHIFTLSMLTSNSFAGVLVLSSFFSQLGKVLGDQLSHMIYGTFQNLAGVLAFGVPPTFAAVGYAFLLGWLATFAFNLARHKGFRVQRKSHILQIEGGLFTLRRYSVQVGSIGFVDIRRSLATCLVGLYSVFIQAVGYGKDTDDVTTVIPAANRRELKACLELLLPEFMPARQMKLRPNPGALFRFLIEPFWLCTLIPLFTWLLRALSPQWSRLTLLVGMVAMVPALWFTMVRILDFFTTGLTREDNRYTLRYSRGFYLHTVVLHPDKIALVEVRQSIFQKRDRRADLIVHSYAQGLQIHQVKNLGFQELKDFLGLNPED